MTRPDPVTRGLWYGTFALMCMIPFLAIPLGFIYRDASAVGWTSFLAIFTAVPFTMAIRGFSKVTAPSSVRWLMLAVFALVAYALAGLFFGTNDYILAGVGIIGILGGYGAGIGAYSLARAGDDPMRKGFFWLLIGMVPLIALPALVGMTVDQYPRSEWLLKLYGIGNPRSLGHYTTIAIVVLFALTAAVLPGGRIPSLPKLVLHFAALVALWSLLMWSGSRGGVVALALGVMISSLLLWRLKIVELLYNLMAAALGSALSLLYVVPHGSYSVLARFVELKETVSSAAVTGAGTSAALDSVTTGRFDLWVWSLQKIMEKPLFGWSFLPMRAIRDLEPDTTPPLAHAHNVLLDYAMGFGIPVALMAAGIVIVLWVRAYGGARKETGPVGLAAFYLATTLPIYSMLSFVLVLPFQLALFGACLGALIGAEARRRAGPEATEPPVKPDAAKIVGMEAEESLLS